MGVHCRQQSQLQSPSSFTWSASVSNYGRRTRQLVKTRGLDTIYKDYSLDFSGEYPSSVVNRTSLEDIFSHQVVNDLDSVVSWVRNILTAWKIVGNIWNPSFPQVQVRNGSLEVISGIFDTFNVFPGHLVLNALVTSFFFLSLYIFVILVPRQ